MNNLQPKYHAKPMDWYNNSFGMLGVKRRDLLDTTTGFILVGFTNSYQSRKTRDIISIGEMRRRLGIITNSTKTIPNAFQKMFQGNIKLKKELI